MGEVSRTAGHPLGAAPVVSIVVVTYNALEYVRACLEGIMSRTQVPYELIVVDNASEPPTRDYLQSLSGIRLILNDENRLWCAGCNQGMRASDPRSRYILLLNSDITIMRDDWLNVMISLVESEPRVGLTGPVFRRVSMGPVYGFIDGQCLLFRRQVLDEVGYFDEVRWPWGGAAAEFAVAAFAKGWIYKAVHKEDEIVIHHRGKSKTPELAEKIERLPRGAEHFREILERHGLRPTPSILDHKMFPRSLRDRLERFRFYYADPVTASQAKM
jgi:GT2 family glycosyltransferase